MRERQHLFVTQLDLLKKSELEEELKRRGMAMEQPPHTYFSAKGEGLHCTLYRSGKLVVQGKRGQEFVEFYLEPELLGHLEMSCGPMAPAMAIPHIGADEAGKGDLFGPLCVAALYADSQGIQQLIDWKVADSKKLNDKRVRELGPKLKNSYQHELVILMPKKYNQLYDSFGNLNQLLAWAHARAMGKLAERTGCTAVLLDQFAHERVIQRALSKLPQTITLEQRPRAEEDPVVAAASILARWAFLLGLHTLEQRFGFPLPKGAAAQTVTAGRAFVAHHGREPFCHVAKLHFKTASL